MTGRVAIFVVLGLALILMAKNATTNTNDAITNLTRYHNRSCANDIALSGANLAAVSLYFDNTANHLNAFNQSYWNSFKNNVSIFSGKLNVVVDTVGGSLRVTSQGIYPATGSEKDTVSIVCRLSAGFFDRFVMLTNNDPGSVPWTTYDTANGNLHSNNTLLIDHYSGNTVMPVFNGRVTSTNAMTITAGTVPVFSQPPQTGVSVTFPDRLIIPTDPVFQPGGLGPDWNQTYAINSGSSLNSDKQLHLQFSIVSGVQKVKYFTGVRLTNRGSGCESPDNTGYYGDFRSGDPVINVPSSGIIYTKGVDVFVEGTVQGKVTVMSDTTGSAGGNIFVTDDLKCNTNPRTNPASNDYIGLIAQNNIVVGNTATNAANSGNDVFQIQASLLALKGGLTAADNRNRQRQQLNVYGSITQGVRKGVGSGSNPIGASSGGFMKGYYFDSRLLNNHAMLMPGTPLMSMDSWLVKSNWH